MVKRLIFIIVEEQNGRFLWKRVPKDNWIELNQKEIFEKVRNAFWESNRKGKRGNVNIMLLSPEQRAQKEEIIQQKKALREEKKREEECKRQQKKEEAIARKMLLPPEERAKNAELAKRKKALRAEKKRGEECKHRQQMEDESKKEEGQQKKREEEACAEKENQDGQKKDKAVKRNEKDAMVVIQWKGDDSEQKETEEGDVEREHQLAGDEESENLLNIETATV